MGGSAAKLTAPSTQYPPHIVGFCTTWVVPVYRLIRILLTLDGMKTNLFTTALVLALLFAGRIPALAGTVWVIPPEAPAYLINPSAAGVDVLEAFIRTPPGVTFDNQGFASLNLGWNATIVNSTYAVEYGPLSNSLAENLDITGGNPLTVDIYAFTGCASQFSATPFVSACAVGDLTDAYQVTFNEGGYVGWTALAADDLALENTDPKAVPEPASMLLIGAGLIGLAVRRYHKRQLGG
jgi:hypothetical protein